MISINELAPGTVIKYQVMTSDAEPMHRTLTVKAIGKKEITFIAWDGAEHTNKHFEFVLNIKSSYGEILLA